MILNGSVKVGFGIIEGKYS